jgi:hypothetical protein
MPADKVRNLGSLQSSNPGNGFAAGDVTEVGWVPRTENGKIAEEVGHRRHRCDGFPETINEHPLIWSKAADPSLSTTGVGSYAAIRTAPRRSRVTRSKNEIDQSVYPLVT